MGERGGPVAGGSGTADGASPGTGIADSRWRMLPLGAPTALVQQATSAAVCFLLGLAGLFGVLVVSGLVAEQLLPGTEAGTTIDLVARGSAAGVLLLGVVGLLALGLVTALHGPVSARALSARRDEGTPAAHVPHPEQWEAATEPSSGLYRIIAIVLLIIRGLFYLIALAAAWSDPDAVALAITGGGALLLGLIWAGIPLTGRVLGRTQEGHVQGLREHWSGPHRIIAAGRVLTAEEIVSARDAAAAGTASEPAPGAGRRSRAQEVVPGARARALEKALLGVVGAFAVAGLLALQLMFAIAYPDRERWSGGSLGDRAELSPETERVVDLVMVLMGLCAAGLLFALAAAVVCEVLAHRAEHAGVRAALADPGAPPPPLGLLLTLVGHGPSPAIAAVEVLAGAVVGLGAGLWFVHLVADLPDWEIYAEAGPQLRTLAPLGPAIMAGALAVMVVGVLVGAALSRRDEGLRDALVQRWPVRQAAETSSESSD
jgi:hypothetical protein